MSTVDSLLAILSVGFMDGLLSVDNALINAAVVSKLPKHLQKKANNQALLWGIASRGVVLFFASLLLKYVIIQLIGALFLVRVGAQHLKDGAKALKEEKSSDEPASAEEMQFSRAVIYLVLTGIAFSIDNVIGASAFTTDFKVMASGVAFSMIVLWVASGAMIKVVDRFPWLKVAAYILVFLMGATLLSEIAGLYHPSTVQKAASIIVVILISGLCAKFPWMRRLATPVTHWVSHGPLNYVAMIIEKTFVEPVVALVAKIRRK